MKLGLSYFQFHSSRKIEFREVNDEKERVKVILLEFKPFFLRVKKKDA